MKITCALIALQIFCSSPCMAETFTGPCIHVADGDTITVLREKDPIKVRLAGIDAPESHQAYGDKAKRFTAAACLDKRVTVTTHGHDRYGRTIGDVRLSNGTDLNLELVEQGYAWQFLKYDHSQRLHDAEATAREHHAGLWHDTDPMPPWEFRHQAH